MATGTIKKTSNERLIIDIPANTYSTYTAALTAVYNAWTSLTDTQKRNSFIVFGPYSIKFPIDLPNNGQFTRMGIADSNNRVTWTVLSLGSSTYELYYYSSSGVSKTDHSSEAQAGRIRLYSID